MQTGRIYPGTTRLSIFPPVPTIGRCVLVSLPVVLFQSRVKLCRVVSAGDEYDFLIECTSCSNAILILSCLLCGYLVSDALLVLSIPPPLLCALEKAHTMQAPPGAVQARTTTSIRSSQNGTEVTTMAQVQSRRLLGSLGPLQVAILALVVITALVHLQRGIGMSMFMFCYGPRGGPPPGGGAGRFPGGPPGGFNLFQYLPLPLPILFLLNGIGYLVLGTALYLPALLQYRRIVRWLLIIFAAT